MVTWTFDLFALFVGIIIGVVIGALVVCFVELQDGGYWDIGFNAGFKAKYSLEKIQVILNKMEEVKNGK